MINFPILMMRHVKYRLNNFCLWLQASWKFQAFIPKGVCILYPGNIKVGKNFSLGEYCQLFCQDPEKGSRLAIGDGVSLNSFVMLNTGCGGTIDIGDNVIIGPMSVIRAANHKFDDPNVPIRAQGHRGGHIKIEDDVWLGAHVIVLPNVTVGRSSVVGAGSVVTKDIPPYSVAVGNPAKVIRSRKELKCPTP